MVKALSWRSVHCTVMKSEERLTVQHDLYMVGWFKGQVTWQRFSRGGEVVEYTESAQLVPQWEVDKAS